MASIESLLERNPGVNGGRLCVSGTGVSVRQVATWYTAGLSAEQIHEEYPAVALAGIYAALAHYLANKDTMDAEMAADEADFQASRQAAASPARA